MLDDRESLVARRNDILEKMEDVNNRLINLEINLNDFDKRVKVAEALLVQGKINDLDLLKVERVLLIEKKEELESYRRILKMGYRVIKVLLAKESVAPATPTFFVKLVLPAKPVLPAVPLDSEAVDILMALNKFVESTRASNDSRSEKKNVYAAFDVAWSQASEATKEYIRNELRYPISARS